MRWGAKRDATEDQVVAVLEAAGWHVHRCSDEGLPDLYLTRPDGPVHRWVEVKTEGGTLRPAQARLWDEWESMGTFVHVLETREDAQMWIRGWCGHDWRTYPVDERGRGAKKSKPKRWIPSRLRAKVKKAGNKPDAKRP